MQNGSSRWMLALRRFKSFCLDDIAPRKSKIPFMRELSSWLLFATAVLFADFITGPLLQFQILFIVPVGLAAWLRGKKAGLLFAILLPLIRLTFYLYWDVSWPLIYPVLNTGTIMLTLAAFAVITGNYSSNSREVKLLEGLLPICSYCKKIRDENDRWVFLEDYIMTHSRAQFSHGICPECVVRYYPEALKK